MKKVILITGASAGMGKVTAHELIKDGHIVYGASRDIKGMESLKKAGGKIIKMDISKEADIKKVVNTVIKKEGRIDVLWNNAGFGLYGPVEETPIEKVRYQFEVNLFGLARITQLVLPQMRKQRRGLIINTSSVGGKIYTPLGAWYHGTKHALEGWSDCLRLEVAQFGIKVVILEPGLIKTQFGKVMRENMPKESLKGPYAKLIRSLSKAQKNYKSSSPMVIAKTMREIISAKKPKTRYLVGSMAKPLAFVRKWFGDKVYDGLIRRMIS